MNLKVINLLYIDNLNVYARRAVKMKRCRALIEEISNNITMVFELEKCAVVHMKLGKLDSSPEVQRISILQDEESYKYLGIIEHDFILHNDTKNSCKKRVLKEIRNILKTEIHNKIYK